MLIISCTSPVKAGRAAFVAIDISEQAEDGYLVDDATARFPEANAIFGTGGGQEVVDLLVGGGGVLQVCHCAKLALPA